MSGPPIDVDAIYADEQRRRRMAQGVDVDAIYAEMRSRGELSPSPADSATPQAMPAPRRGLADRAAEAISAATERVRDVFTRDDEVPFQSEFLARPGRGIAERAARAAEAQRLLTQGTPADVTATPPVTRAREAAVAAAAQPPAPPSPAVSYLDPVAIAQVRAQARRIATGRVTTNPKTGQPYTDADRQLARFVDQNLAARQEREESKGGFGRRALDAFVRGAAVPFEIGNDLLGAPVPSSAFDLGPNASARRELAAARATGDLVTEADLDALGITTRRGERLRTEPTFRESIREEMLPSVAGQAPYFLLGGPAEGALLRAGSAAAGRLGARSLSEGLALAAENAAPTAATALGRAAQRAVIHGAQGAVTGAALQYSDARLAGETPGEALDEAATGAALGVPFGGGVGVVGGAVADVLRRTAGRRLAARLAQPAETALRTPDARQAVGAVDAARAAEGKLPLSDQTPEAQYAQLGALFGGLLEQRRAALSPDERLAQAAALGARQRVEPTIAPAQVFTPRVEPNPPLRTAAEIGAERTGLKAMLDAADATKQMLRQQEEQRLLAEEAARAAESPTARLAAVARQAPPPTEPVVRPAGPKAITQEAVSSGPTFGFAPEVASAPERVRRRFTRTVARALVNPENGRDQVDEIANSIFGTRYRARRVEAEGMFEGARNPNIIYSYPPDTPDEYLRLNAALRGLVLGQEAQAWMQRVPRGTPGAQPGYIVRLAGGEPVTPAVYAEIERIVRSDPRFAPYGGSTLHDGEVVFRNFTGGDEAAYEQGLRALLDKVPANLQLGRAAYTGEYLDGIGAYLRHTGQRADVLRRAAHLLRTKLAPLYERAAREHGGNPAATVERVRQTAAALGRAADALDAGGTVEDAEAAFSRVLSEGAPSRDSRLFPPTERFAIAGAAALGASQSDDDERRGALGLAGLGALALATEHPATFFARTFSRLARAIERAPFERGTAEQWAAALAKDVAKSEREWTGIDRFLAEHAGQVLSKDQVRDLFERNRIRLGETVLRKPDDRINAVMREYAAATSRLRAIQDDPAIRFNVDPYRVQQEGEAYIATLPERYREPAREIAALQARRMALLDERDALLSQRLSPPPRFEAYTEPGGENYREILLTLGRPPRPPALTAAEEAEKDDLARRLGRGETLTAAEERRLRELRERAVQAAEPAPTDYRSPHFDVPDILAHARVKDRRLPNGEKALFIEEIQSDWHQAGRREGYAVPGTPEEIEAARSRLGRARAAYDAYSRERRDLGLPEDDERGRALGREFVAADEALYALTHPRGVPDAPFKKTEEWMGLALKRLIDEAIEGGYDRIAWTTGDQQAARYHLARRVSRITYDPARQELTAFSRSGEVVRGRYTPAELVDVIGKEPAQRLLASAPDQQGLHVIEGDDLRVGGEGMRAFYDRMIPQWLKEYAKKLGVKLDIEAAAFEQPATPTGRMIYRGPFLSDSHIDATVRRLRSGRVPNFAIAGTGTLDPVDAYRIAAILEHLRQTEPDFTERPRRLGWLLDSQTDFVQQNTVGVLGGWLEPVTEAAPPLQAPSVRLPPELRAKIKQYGQPLLTVAAMAAANAAVSRSAEAQDGEAHGPGALFATAAGGVAVGAALMYLATHGKARRLLRENRALARELLRDPLTGLANKRALERAIPSVDADPQWRWLVFDGDQFKRINDTLGHAAGDRALQHFGRTIMQVAEDLKVPMRGFRGGGDEFSFAAPADRAEEVLRAIQERSRLDLGQGVTTRLTGAVGDTWEAADLAANAVKEARRQANPGLRRRELTQLRTGKVTPEILIALASTPLTAAVGALQGDTPDERKHNMLIGALLPVLSLAGGRGIRAVLEAGERALQRRELGKAQRQAIEALLQEVRGKRPEDFQPPPRQFYSNPIGPALAELRRHPTTLGVAALGALLTESDDPDIHRTGAPVIALAALHAIGTHRLIAAKDALGRALLDALRKTPTGTAVARFFNPDALLSPEIRKAIRQYESTVAKGQARAKEFSAMAAKLGPQADRAISDVIEGESFEDITGMSAETLEAVFTVAAAITKEMDELGQRKVAAGVIAPEQYAKYAGRYLPRRYAEWDALDAMGEQRAALLSGKRTRISAQHSRMDLTPEERNALGEIREASYRTAYGLDKGYRDVAAAELVQTLRHTPGVIHPEFQSALDDFLAAKDLYRAATDKADREAALALMDQAKVRMNEITRRFEATGGKGEYVALPDTKGLGVLRGMVVQRDVANSINGIPDAKAVGKVLRWWKEAHTVFNPGTHVANVSSNIMLAHLGGMSVAEQPYWLALAAKDLRRYGEGTRALAEAGILDLNAVNATSAGATGKRVTSQEGLEALLRTTRPETARVLRERGVPETRGPGIVRRSADAIRRVYNTEDNVFRVAMYLKARAEKRPFPSTTPSGLGKTEAEAIALARDTFGDFRTRSPALRLLRTTGLAPFILWPAKVLPQVAKNIVDHPWRYITLIASWAALDQYSKHTVGPIEERDISPRDRRRLGYFLPGLTQLPFTGTRGEKAAIDIARFTPLSALTTAAPPGTAAGALDEDYPAILTPSGPWTDLTAKAVLNRDPFTGEEIIKRDYPRGENIGRALGAIVNEGLPPALGFHRQRITEDLRNRDYTAAKTDILGPLGLRPRYIRPGMNALNAAFQLENAIREMQQDLQRGLRKSKSPERNRELAEQYLRRVQSAIAHYRERIGAEPSAAADDPLGLFRPDSSTVMPRHP